MSDTNHTLLTCWGKNLNVNQILPEYPRPEMVRESFLSLNGIWHYAIRPVGSPLPSVADGDILVPFPLESTLSGVRKCLTPQEELFYFRTVDLPPEWLDQEALLLHFGAVDYRAEVFVNGIAIGTHEGGYTPFAFDIAPYLVPGVTQKLCVRVWDGTDAVGAQPVGKQTCTPHGIWYTSVSGIWQSVFLEPVPAMRIVRVSCESDIDNATLGVSVELANAVPGAIVAVQVRKNQQLLAEAKAAPNVKLRLSIPDALRWSPAHPHLYDLDIVLALGDRVIDRVQSYAAMRKISVVKDGHGVPRLALNNEILFQFGPLDQGWWPDGLYTAPTDEALQSDIVLAKSLGFNMIRKHVKVEPSRWYYHCDRLGMLVWQDMPNIHRFGHWAQYTYNGGSDAPLEDYEAAAFEREWQEVIKLCALHPSVVVFTPFNENWGQYDTERIAAMTKTLAAGQLVNPASGGNHRPCGDLLDIHHYPGPAQPLADPLRVNVLGEYGGLGQPVAGHLWLDAKAWSYKGYESQEELTKEYCRLAAELEQLAAHSYAAAVYTQLTDVEGEVNGLVTYDRAVLKVDPEKIRAANIHCLALHSFNDKK